MFFDRQTYDFTGSFEFDSKVIQPTIIFINKDYFYQNGYSIEVTSGSNNVKFHTTETLINHLNLFIDDESLSGKLIKVVI